MKKPLNRQPMYIQELLKEMKSDEDNRQFFKHILNSVLKQPFSIIEMYNEKSTPLCNNRDYKALTKGTQYIIIEYYSDSNMIEDIYVGVRGNNRRNKGIFYNDKFNPYGYTSVRDYKIFPTGTFYMITQ